MNNAFRDAGDELAAIIEDIEKGNFQMFQPGDMVLKKNISMGVVSGIVVAAMLPDRVRVRWDTCISSSIKVTSLLPNTPANRQLLEERREKHVAKHWHYATDESDEEESSEDRLERQAQAHLESAALHRDDPMF